jgi:hypothetical protein
MANDQTREPDRQRPPEPRVVRLPGFISDGDIGFGDVLKRVSAAAGIAPCGACAERARRLNNRLVFKGPGR